MSDPAETFAAIADRHATIWREAERGYRSVKDIVGFQIRNTARHKAEVAESIAREIRMIAERTSSQRGRD